MATNVDHQQQQTTETPISDSLRFLRHVEGVEFNGTSENWDAKTCFVLLVSVQDKEIAAKGWDALHAKLASVERPAEPFQIERTTKELNELQAAMLKWCSKHKDADDKQPTACAFCAPIASGEAVATAKKEANEDASPSSGGLLSSIFKGGATKLSSEEEWETWLNATIERVRTMDVTGLDECEGVQHVPALLAKFLLNEFASDILL